VHERRHLTLRLRRVIGHALAAFTLAACAAATGGGVGGGGSPGILRDDDVLLLSRFSDVTGIAASRRYVFVAGPRGLAIYDAQFNWWLPPREGTRFLSAFQRTLMAADPISDAVWMGGVGEVRYYQPSTDYTMRVPLPGIVDAIVFNRRDPGQGALVRSGGVWTLVSTIGSTRPIGSLPPPSDLIVPPDLADVYRRYPALRDLQGNITRDERLREWPVTSGTIAPDRSEVFLGTRGNGIYRVDPNFVRGQNLPYGLLSEGAGAVALASDGIWVAPAGMVAGIGSTLRPRGGLTFVRGDLQEWRWIEGDREDLLAQAAANDLAMRGSVAWIATDAGVARIDTRQQRPQVLRWSLVNGLPSDQALSLAPREGGAWVGTARGLVFVSDTGRRVQPVAARVGDAIGSGLPVRALLSTGDTLWMGTDAGLLLLPPGEERAPVRSTLQQLDPRLGGQVRAIAASDSVVIVGLAMGDIVRVDRRAGRVLPRTSADATLAGPVIALAIDGLSIYVVGTRGVVALDREGGTSRFLSLSELGSEAFDVVLSQDAAWIATRAGVVRLARRAGGLPR
jgi:hypothetical protein